jgi:DNA-directed RNA polymerase specialized sigma24 family protein
LARRIRAVCRCPHLAEDAAAEALVRAWTKFGPECCWQSLVPWLVTTATHWVLGRCRRRSWRASVPLAAAETLADPGAAAWWRTDGLRESLQRVRERLPPTEAQTLRFLELGYDVAETAAVVGVTPRAVQRSLVRLRAAFAGLS